jgi:hypothetical protein
MRHESGKDWTFAELARCTSAALGPSAAFAVACLIDLESWTDEVIDQIERRFHALRDRKRGHNASGVRT